MTDNSGEIFVIRETDGIVALQLSPFPREQQFQELLARHPQLLTAGTGGRRLLLVRREAPIRHGDDGATGWLDHLFVDEDGVPTLVEVKRSSDSRIRREVVGQMLDYASNAAFGWSVDRMKSFFDSTCEEAGLASADTLAEFLAGEEPHRFWDEVKTNLQAGKLRLLFVADEIPSDLRRIIEFLNQQTDPLEVLGVEIRQFVGEGIATLLPKVVGRTEKSDAIKPRPPAVKWSEESLFERMNQVATPEESQAVRRLLDWAASRVPLIWWGEGPTDPSFVPTEIVDGIKHQVFAAYGGSEKSAACVYPYFEHYAKKPPFVEEALRRELLARFNAVPGINLPPEAITKRPRINIGTLSSEALEGLLEVFDWYLSEVRRADVVNES